MLAATVMHCMLLQRLVYQGTTNALPVSPAPFATCCTPSPDLLARDGGGHSGADVGAGWQGMGAQGDSLMMAEQLPQRKKQAVQQQDPPTAPASPVPAMGRRQELGWNLPAINTSRSSGSAGRASSAVAPAPNASEGSTNSQQALEGGDGSDHSGGASCGVKEGPSPALRQALEALKERLEAGAASVSGETLALWRWLLPLTTNTNFFKPCPVCGINACEWPGGPAGAWGC